MNKTIVNQINADLYEDGKIYWSMGKGWSSKLWQRLYTLGWRILTTPSGLRVIVDPQENKIETGHLSFVYALKYIAELMR